MKTTKNMARTHNLPIIIGHLQDEKSDKCILAVKKKGHVRITICRLKDKTNLKLGDEIKIKDIGGIIQEIWICRKETLKVFIDSLQKLYDKWDN